MAVSCTQGATQPAHDLAVADEAARQQNEGAHFQCRSPRTQCQCTDTQGTQNEQNNNLQKSSSNFVPIVCHVCGFGLFLSPPDLLPADATAAC